MIVTRVEHGGSRYLARIDGDTAILLQREASDPSADVFRDALGSGTDLTAAGEHVALSSVRLLAPTRRPGKLLAVGNNYLAHARESESARPSAPVIFAKFTTSIIGPGDAIVFSPDQSAQVDYEAELAVVIGRGARRVSVDDASAFIFGYTVCNDISARDAQFGDGQWVRAKSFDTFAPLGPWVVTRDSLPEAQNAAIRTRLNGAMMQDADTSEMIFSVAELVSYVSAYITLEPGDVIATGTPEGVGFARVPPVFLSDGDVIEVEVAGVGTLRNEVVVSTEEFGQASETAAVIGRRR